MSRGGSEYRKKHFVEKIDRQSQEEREIVEKPYMAVIYHNEGYIEDFYRLSAENKYHAYEKLSARAHTDKNALRKLDDILFSIGLKRADHDGRYLHKQELLTVRMDFYGTIDRIKPGLKERELSLYYRNLMANPLEKAPDEAEYDFKSSPSWKLFSRFQSFRRIEKNLKAYLFKNKIDPQILQLMTPRDFSDLVVQAFQKSDKELKITFETDITVRHEFVRDLAKKQGDQMTTMLLKQGWDKRWVCSMMNMMRRYGKYNSAKLVITEINFTSKNLSDLKKAQESLFAEINSSDFSKLGSDQQDKLKKLFKKVSRVNAQKFKPGDRIPQTLIDAVIDADLGDLLAARDKRGRKLCGSDFPSFQVHHGYAASDAGSLKNVAYANYKKYLCLVEEKVHRFIHQCDVIKRRGESRSYSKRLEFIDPKTSFMIGFLPTERLSYDFEQGEPTTRKKMDDKHIVSYSECMAQLKLNQKAYDKEHGEKESDIPQKLPKHNSLRKFKKARKMLLKVHTR